MHAHRDELSDLEWSIVAPLLPNKPREVARADDRKVLNGIYWRLRTGSPWADIPERYSPATTCYKRFVRWRKIGVWDTIFDAVSKAYSGDLQMVDSSSIRVHQHAADENKGSQETNVAASGDVVGIRCMGRSRGGLTTKIHAVVDADNPILLKLSEGQAHDGRSAADMLDSVGPGQTLLADRGYDSDALRQTLADRGACANVKPMPGRVNVPIFSPYL